MAEKLLIVDDDLDTLRLIGLMLERQGYEIIAASNGQQALNLVKTEMPDLIILDVMMPDLDGYEVARRLRADEATEAIPIIMFTAKSQMDDRVTGIEAGADAYLTKPTQPRELFAHIKSMLARKQKVVLKPTVPLVKHGKIVGVISTKGGMGVSSLAINLGIIVRKKTNSGVIVAEYRPGYGGISIDLGYTNPEGLTRLLENHNAQITLKDVEKELVSHPSGVKLLLASPQPKDGKYLAEAEKCKEITGHLKSMVKYIFLDLGSSLNPIASEVVSLCNLVIIVLEPTPVSTQLTKEMIKDLRDLGIGESKMMFALVNRIRSSVQLGWSQVQEELGHKITTVFTPAPELAYQASLNNNPLVLQQPESVTATQFEKMADHVLTLLG